MGIAKFWPPPIAPTFFFVFLKLKTKKHIQDTIPHAKFGKVRFTGGVWSNTQILAVYSGLPFLFFFVFFAQHPGRTTRRTVTNEGSKRVFLAKKVPFGDLNNEK